MTQIRNVGADAAAAAEPIAAVTAQLPPLTARSVLASALLGMDPPELPVAQLVRLTGLFGISENRARVALSRMVAAGEATSDGSGRYRLAGHLAARQSRQSASRTGATAAWDGEWMVAVVTTTGSTAEVRSARRRALAYARLVELREGVWMRPANVEVRLPASWDADVELLSARPSGPRELAGRLWDLRAWADRAAELVRGLGALAPDRPEALAPGFTLSAAVLRHLQADPLLPAELLPAGWPGTQLRATYDDWDARYRATLRVWSRGPAAPADGRR
jgi:phenylacetic acid degradation operon negative regulatory protein